MERCQGIWHLKGDNVNASIPAGYTTLASKIDASVNFFAPTEDGGKIETRFVQRTSDRFIVYISSMSGCDKACRFCHLTQLGETMATHLTKEQMLDQARKVLSAGLHGEAKLVHFNFMARGEPLANRAVDKELFKGLAAIADAYGLKCRIKISSILPKDVVSADGRHLWDETTPPIDLYYSLYSVDASWRRRWLPKALPAASGLEWLARFQKQSGNRVILHWALIDNENSGEAASEAAFALALMSDLKFDFNLVRYNPANVKSKEACETDIAKFMNLATSKMQPGHRARMVQRVGFDVAASCGMFIGGSDSRAGLLAPA